MKSFFGPEFFAGNRKRLRGLVSDNAPIVVTANALLQRNSDMAHPFRQDSNFWYLTGINQPEVVLVIEKDKDYLIVPERNEVRNVFDGSIDRGQLKKRSHITDILNSDDGWKRLSASIKRAKKVATLPALPKYVEIYEFYTNPARASLLAKLKSRAPGLELLDIKESLSGLRMIKQPEELQAIQASVELTIEGFQKLGQSLPEFSSEHEVEAFLFNTYRSKGARFGYTPMIASGPNACVLHYDSNNENLAKNHLLLVDSGAEQEFYSADITRVFSVGNLTTRQKTVHAAVAEVHKYALGLTKPGKTVIDNKKKIEKFMGEKLRELGLIKKIEREAIRKYFPHRTSHFLGLDVHDSGDYERPLEPGMVLTVEPGIYIPQEGIGVRIEDDILVTKNGHQNLSASLPISLS